MQCVNAETAQPSSPAAAPAPGARPPATPPLALQLSSSHTLDEGPPTPLELSPPPSPRNSCSTESEATDASVHGPVPPSPAPACTRAAAAGWSWGHRFAHVYSLLCALPFTYKPSHALRRRWYAEARQEAVSGGGAPPAARQLLRQMNKGNVGAEPVDLHGLHCAEAVGVVRDVVRSFTQEWPRWRYSMHVVAFGVGCGRHSQGAKSRLRPAVVAALQDSNIHFCDRPQDGCVFAVFYPPQQA